MRESLGRLGLAIGWGHDIRTHLNILLSAINMMESGKLTPEKETQYYAMMRHNILEILRLVNHLMEYERGEESDENPADNAGLQIDGLLTSLLESVKPFAADKELELLYDVECPLYAWCNAELLERVLYNLLSNAIKYTQAGGFVYVSARSDQESVYISVHDTGKGLSEEQQLRLSEECDCREGEGHGLHLVRKMMQSMKADIDCISRAHVGTTFCLKFPAIPACDAVWANNIDKSILAETTCFAAPS